MPEAANSESNRPEGNNQNGLSQVQHIVAVASGKGGVGKSTTAVNLALALAAHGAKVGILDADIYGPSLPVMLGIESGTRPQVKENKFFLPLQVMGLKTMSMGFLATEQTPLVWRGPMAASALVQMLGQTLWGELDYLIVDMPPGTGDIQLSLAQKAQLCGAVIVTTPQDIALLDARKGIEMFAKVNVPVLGIVENMALHTCSNCGHEEHIFGAGGGARVAQEYDAELLGSLPLKRAIMDAVGNGKPSLAADPDAVESKIYLDIARSLHEKLQQRTPQPSPEIIIE